MELYHVLNRGVDKRNIFLDTQDRARFVHDMYEFNDTETAKNVGRLMSDFVSRSLEGGIQGNRVVNLHGWCLMKNHYHLLISETAEGGLTKFIRKLNIGYAKYFNEKYQRVGTLFQGRTKKVHITTDAHFLYILHYIHLNLLDFLRDAKGWRSGSVKNPQKALAHLAEYRWSSYLDYCGKKNFPSVLSMELFADVFGDYQNVITEYIRDMQTEPFDSLSLE